MVCQQVLAAQRLKRANFEKPPGGQHPWQPVRESPQSPVAWFQTCGQLLHSVFGTCTWYAVQLKGNLLQILSQFWELLLLKPSLNPNPRMVWGTCQQEFTQHDSRMESFKPSADQHELRWKQAHTHSERTLTGFEQRPKIAATYHQLLVLGRVQQNEFCGTRWFRCYGTVVAPLPHHWTSLHSKPPD